MWELDHKEDWVPKNWCLQIVVMEKTLESPLDSNNIKLVTPKGNESWIFIGRTDAQAEAAILWQHNAKSRLIEKDPDAVKSWGQEQKQATEDEMVGWNYWLNEHEFEWTLAVVKDRDAWPATVYGVTKRRTQLMTEQQQNTWTVILKIIHVIKHKRSLWNCYSQY